MHFFKYGSKFERSFPNFMPETHFLLHIFVVCFVKYRSNRSELQSILNKGKWCVSSVLFCCHTVLISWFYFDQFGLSLFIFGITFKRTNNRNCLRKTNQFLFIEIWSICKSNIRLNKLIFFANFFYAIMSQFSCSFSVPCRYFIEWRTEIKWILLNFAIFLIEFN